MIESAVLLLINKIKRTKEGFNNEDNNLLANIPVSWIIISLIISIGTAYIAFMCNANSTPATRFIVTIFAFLFSGLYLVYYFIVHILLFYPCGSTIATVTKRIKSKR